MMIGTTLNSATIGVLIAVTSGPARPPTLSATQTPNGRNEQICHPVKDLEPKVSAGALESVPSELSGSGSLMRWAAAEGDTLRVKVRASDPGTYEISIRAVQGPDGPALSARAWEVPLTREGQVRFMRQDPGHDGPLDIRFDPIPMGPGYHVLELECLVPGEALLDCVGLRRTGDATEGIGRPAASVAERPFLGVELGPPQQGGVTINRTIPDTAAQKAGLEPGDVLVTIDGVRMPELERVQDAIAAHRPGDRVELGLRRNGERITRQVELGRRPEAPEQRRTRAARVIDVLQVQPGQVIADIGCGSGWLSEVIAEVLGSEGTVYAVEIQERLVRRLHRWSPPNVVPVLSAPHDVLLPQGCLDTAMLHDVASHISRPARPRFYESLARALKPRGRLVVFGPHGNAAAMLRELRGYGFIPVDDDALGALSPEDLDQRLEDGIVFGPQ
jgi:SAM-dependent methyltransferase